MSPISAFEIRSVPTKQERNHLHDIGLAPTKLPNREGDIESPDVKFLRSSMPTNEVAGR